MNITVNIDELLEVYDRLAAYSKAEEAKCEEPDPEILHNEMEMIQRLILEQVSIKSEYGDFYDSDWEAWYDYSIGEIDRTQLMQTICENDKYTIYYTLRQPNIN